VRNISDKSCSENQNTRLCSLNFSPETVPFMR